MRMEKINKYHRIKYIYAGDRCIWKGTMLHVSLHSETSMIK